MCELLGLNANTPTDICFSFRGFASRGGKTGDHTDGWGIAFYQENRPIIIRDTQPCAASKLAEAFKTDPIASTNIISHVRKATQGEIRIENCHPFGRSVQSQDWIFAHNGDLKDFHPVLNEDFQTIGNTDSERAFCKILQNFALDEVNQNSKIEAITDSLVNSIQPIKDYGVINFLLSNGHAMWAFCSSSLHSITRCHPFGFSELIDEDYVIDFSNFTTPKDVVTVITTQPLTSNEQWDPFAVNELRVFQDGFLQESILLGS
jgi:glutamine amidotransferase